MNGLPNNNSNKRFLAKYKTIIRITGEISIPPKLGNICWNGDNRGLVSLFKA